jgi:acetyl-CoA carboxylase beta subunit
MSNHFDGIGLALENKPNILEALTPLGFVGLQQQNLTVCLHSSPHTMDANERSHTMGDKGGKKDKDKDQKQKITKKEQQDKIKQEKQPKKSP